jgi:molybdate transport system substrate-binding protein
MLTRQLRGCSVHKTAYNKRYSSMYFRHTSCLLGAVVLLGSCEARRGAEPINGTLTVAAAANLTDVFNEAGQEFKARTGLEVVFSYGATAQLAQQIANGAPFDLFAAADTKHVDDLILTRKLVGESRKVYAQGQLALLIPGAEQSEFRGLKDLLAPRIRFVAIAQPELAPYGFAAVEALKSAGLWESVQSKIIYANSVNMARQLAASGNAEAAFTAYSLVLHDRGMVLKVDPHLYHPLAQAMAIVASSARMEEAKRFQAFLAGAEGKAILTKSGYLLP